MTDSPRKPRGRALLVAIAGAIVAAFLALIPASAMAASHATPSPSAAAQSVGIWIRLDSDKSNVPGVSVSVTGPGGFSTTVATGADGKVIVGVPDAGLYTVTVDQKTIPAGSGVPKAGSNPREVQIDRGNTGVPAYFLLTTSPGGGASPAPGASTAPNPPVSTATTPSLAQVLLPRIATGLIFGLLIALASIGVSLIYGTTGLNNFAHGELVTFGGLVGYIVSGVYQMPGWTGILAALVFGGVFGWLQDAGLWKPLRRKSVSLVPLMIVSIGLSLALRYFYQFTFGPGLMVTPNNNSAFLALGPVNLRFTDVSSPVIAIIVLLLVAFVMLRTRIGKATRAVSDNRALAAASGINVERVIRIVWIGSGALAGLSGALIGYYQPVNWETGASILLLIFAAVTLGGLGTAFGALVGSLVIGLLVDLSTIFIPSNMKFVAALLVMIVILLFRPQGILGRRDRVG